MKDKTLTQRRGERGADKGIFRTQGFDLCDSQRSLRSLR